VAEKLQTQADLHFQALLRGLHSERRDRARSRWPR
jgi:hypothetical protein